MKNYVLAVITAFALTFISGAICIPWLKKLKLGQTILKYVEEHKSKNGTPTMGGLFFVLSAIITFLFFCGVKGRIAIVCIVICVAYMVIGFLDDFIKIKFSKNEGLKPYQKIIFQVAVGFAAGIFAYKNGLTEFFVPFTTKSVNLNVFTIPVIAFIFIAMTNCVNLTDGLDGLATSASLGYLAPFMIALYFENYNGTHIVANEYDSLMTLCFCFAGSLLGFLIFNTNKASVFMGDTGSLALGGLLASLALFSGNGFYVPFFGIVFVLSGVSVIIQVLYYKKTKKRIFLMSPFHHHLQHKGISESKISYIYMTVNLFIGTISLINYL